MLLMIENLARLIMEWAIRRQRKDTNLMTDVENAYLLKKINKIRRVK